MPFRLSGSITARPIFLLMFAALFAYPAGPAARAQTVTPEIRDRSDHLDVPYVPSHDNVLQAMFDLAKPTREDFLIDLGSGDGRIVIEAARRFGTRGFGVDLNEGLVRIAKEKARRAGVASKAQFYVRDIFQTDISRATVLTMYLLPDVVQEMRPHLLRKLRPGTRVVSHDYHLAGWRPDASRIVDISKSPDKPEDSVIYYWVVPARVSGKWEWTLDYPKYVNPPLEYTGQFKQNFQDLGGLVDALAGEGRIHRGTISGKNVTITVYLEVKELMVRHEFSGMVSGNVITGTAKLSGGVRPITLPWRAVRTGKTD